MSRQLNKSNWGTKGEGQINQKLYQQPLNRNLFLESECVATSKSTFMFLLTVHSYVHYPCYTEVHQRPHTLHVSVNDSTGKVACQHCPRKGFGQIEQLPGITCHPLHLRPEKSRPVGWRWQMLLPSVPVGQPAASVATPAGRALPAAAVPTEMQSKQTRKGKSSTYYAHCKRIMTITITVLLDNYACRAIRNIKVVIILFCCPSPLVQWSSSTTLQVWVTNKNQQ